VENLEYFSLEGMLIIKRMQGLRKKIRGVVVGEMMEEMMEEMKKEI
jgi:hypothetical protein